MCHQRWADAMLSLNWRPLSVDTPIEPGSSQQPNVWRTAYIIVQMVLISTLHYKVCQICCKLDVPASNSNNENCWVFRMYFTIKENCWEKRSNHLGNYISPSLTDSSGKTCPHEKASWLLHSGNNFSQVKASLDCANLPRICFQAGTVENLALGCMHFLNRN